MLKLWDYAVKVYAIPGVQEKLLKLQDRYHFDVNALLWCLWAGRYGFSFEKDEVEKVLSATDDMARHTTRPLRAVRLWLSAPKPGFDRETMRALRAQVLEAELASEKMILERLDVVTLAVGEPNEVFNDMELRSERLFTFTRGSVDTPIMITDEEGPNSPLGLFRAARDLAKDLGP